MLSRSKALALILAAAVFAAPASALAGETGTAAAIQDYAQREAQAADLEQFTGGWHGVVATVVIFVLVAWLVWKLIDDRAEDKEERRAREKSNGVHP